MGDFTVMSRYYNTGMCMPVQCFHCFGGYLYIHPTLAVINYPEKTVITDRVRVLNCSAGIINNQATNVMNKM